MDIRQLQYFVTVVEEKTVTNAAQVLHMTQPPLTAQLHALENELGCKLFRHEGRRLYLTDAGRHLYSRAIEILGMCDTIKQEMTDFREGVAGTLRIGVISSVQGTLFTSWMKKFQQKYPNVKISIHSANTYELLEQLQNRVIDLAIVRSPFPKKGLDILQLQTEYILAVGHKSYFPENQDSMISIAELSKMPLIIYRRWQKIIEASFEAVGCTPQVYCINDDARMTLLLVMQGMGVGMLHPSALSETLDSSIEIRTLKENSLASQIALVCQNKRQLPETVQLFWQMVQNQQENGGIE